MNEHELKKELMAKHKICDEVFADFMLRTYSGMYYAILAHSNWHTPAKTQEDKIRDCCNNLPQDRFALEYCVRHDFQHLIPTLEYWLEQKPVDTSIKYKFLCEE